MVIDGLRGYLQLATGVTDVTRERAQAAAKAVLAQGESVGAVLPDSVRAQVSSLTDDLLAASRANRALLVHLVRAEVERSVARLGLVSAHEAEAASARARSLERRVHELEKELAGAKPAGRPTAKKSAKKSTAKKSTVKRAAKKPAAKKPAATEPLVTGTPAGTSAPSGSNADPSTPDESPATGSTTA